VATKKLNKLIAIILCAVIFTGVVPLQNVVGTASTAASVSAEIMDSSESMGTSPITVDDFEGDTEAFMAEINRRAALAEAGNPAANIFGRENSDAQCVTAPVGGMSVMSEGDAPAGPEGGKIIEISAGFYLYFLMDDGTVWFYYGPGIYEQVNELENIVSIKCGATYNIALDANGKVWEWEVFDDCASEITAFSNVTRISNCANICMALTADGAVWDWVNTICGISSSNDHGPELRHLGGYPCVYVAAGSVNYAIIERPDWGRTVVGWPVHNWFGDGAPANMMPASSYDSELGAYVLATESGGCYIDEIFNGFVNYWASGGQSQSYIGGYHYGYGFAPYGIIPHAQGLSIVDVGTTDYDLYVPTELFLMDDGSVWEVGPENSPLNFWSWIYDYGHEAIVPIDGLENIVYVTGSSGPEGYALDEDGSVWQVRPGWYWGATKVKKIIEGSASANGVVYRGGILTPVTWPLNLNAKIETSELYVNSGTVQFDFNIHTDSGIKTFSGAESVYRNISDLVGEYEALAAVPFEDEEWSCLSFTFEDPAIEQILLPVNRRALTGKAIFKIALLYKETGDIYYYEGRLPDSVTYAQLSAIAANAASSPGTRDATHGALTWFFNYMHAEGEAWEPEEYAMSASSSSMAATSTTSPWKDSIIPNTAYTQLGYWMSVGLNRGRTVGYYTGVYKYPKNNPVEQNLYGWVAADYIVWQYVKSGIEDNKRFDIVNRQQVQATAAQEITATLKVLYSGQYIIDTKKNDSYDDTTITNLFLGSIEVGVAIPNGAEIINLIQTDVTRARTDPETVFDFEAAVKKEVKFLIGKSPYGKVINGIVDMVSLVKTSQTEKITGVETYGDDLLTQIEGNDGKLITFAARSSLIEGKEYYLFKPGDNIGIFIKFVNPAPDNSCCPGWDRKIGQNRTMVLTYNFDVCEYGVKSTGYYGVVVKQHVYDNDPNVPNPDKTAPLTRAYTYTVNYTP
jgi:hypothetical protein